MVSAYWRFSMDRSASVCSSRELVPLKKLVADPDVSPRAAADEVLCAPLAVAPDTAAARGAEASWLDLLTGEPLLLPVAPPPHSSWLTCNPATPVVT